MIDEEVILLVRLYIAIVFAAYFAIYLFMAEALSIEV